jgi:hypothetical protein
VPDGKTVDDGLALGRFVADPKENTSEENARLFAAINVAMADALIGAWMRSTRSIAGGR